MRLVQYAKLSLIGALVITAAACSTTGSKKQSANMAAGSKGATSQTYGLNGQAGYKTQRNSLGEIINPLRAPANQTYYFAFDSNNVAPKYLRAIRIQANYLASHPYSTIRLEGNTDNRGSREYNIGLGWRRDQAVAKLLEQYGVQPKQIEMVSYGKERPAVAGNNDRAWHLNRRVHLVYTGLINDEK